MLNTQEIRDLERRLRKYRNKKYFNYFISIFVVVAIVSASVYVSFFYKTNNSNKKVLVSTEQKVSKMETPIAKKLKKEVIVESNKSIQKKDKNNTSLNVSKEKVISPKASSSSMVKTEQNSTKQQIVETNKTAYQPKRNNYENVLVLNTNFMNKIFTKMNQEEKAEKNKNKNSKIVDKKISSSQKNITDKVADKNKSVVKKRSIEPKIEKPKILISSKKIDKIKYLEDRYRATKKVLYAILLSKEFYNRHNYKLSLKWAIIANDIDNTNEDSWLMFAKNKVKLGNKQEAIKALSIYLKSYNSTKVKRLLSDIKSGAMK